MDILLLFDYLPKVLRNIAYRMPREFRERGEEIRIRANRPLKAVIDGKSFSVEENGAFCESGGFIVSPGLIKACFEQFTAMSPYAFESEIANGYITVEGGHRIGFCGTKTGKTMRDISSFNIRISREVRGVSDEVDFSDIKNTLVISPPGGGKTTFLRDAARRISNCGKKVCIIDERCEIAASFRGVLQHDVGENTDVLSGFLLSEGIMTALRTMGPDIIVTDEIGGREDEDAISAALKSGVKVLASAHGGSKDEAIFRLGDLANSFERFIIIEKQCDVRRVLVV